jgi:ribosomal protein L37AE/L43A
MLGIGKSFHKEYVDAMKQVGEIGENIRKEKSCSLHDFDAIIKHNRIEKWKCKNCGCVEDSNFVDAYYRGLAHGRGQRNEDR